MRYISLSVEISNGGGESQIWCELDLLKTAVRNNHDYYHFISGVCLPLKSNEEINNFFEERNGLEFVAFDKKAIQEHSFYNRFDKWHFKIRSATKNKVKLALIRVCNYPLRILGKVLDIITGKRSKKYSELTFMKGSSFFHITHNLATYVVGKEKLIKKMFRFSACCDEVFLQTITYNSPFARNITDYKTRYIDWSAGGSSPAVLTMRHYNDLISCNQLFARKFSSEKSAELIEKLYDINLFMDKQR